jgi:hypothetical protein
MAAVHDPVDVTTPRRRGRRAINVIVVANPGHSSSEDDTPANSATFYSSAASNYSTAPSRPPTIRAPSPRRSLAPLPRSSSLRHTHPQPISATTASPRALASPSPASYVSASASSARRSSAPGPACTPSPSTLNHSLNQLDLGLRAEPSRVTRNGANSSFSDRHDSHVALLNGMHPPGRGRLGSNTNAPGGSDAPARGTPFYLSAAMNSNPELLRPTTQQQPGYVLRGSGNGTIYEQKRNDERERRMAKWKADFEQKRRVEGMQYPSIVHNQSGSMRNTGNRTMSLGPSSLRPNIRRGMSTLTDNENRRTLSGLHRPPPLPRASQQHSASPLTSQYTSGPGGGLRDTLACRIRDRDSTVAVSDTDEGTLKAGDYLAHMATVGMANGEGLLPVAPEAQRRRKWLKPSIITIYQ